MEEVLTVMDKLCFMKQLLEYLLVSSPPGLMSTPTHDVCGDQIRRCDNFLHDGCFQVLFWVA